MRHLTALEKSTLSLVADECGYRAIFGQLAQMVVQHGPVVEAVEVREKINQLGLRVERWVSLHALTDS